MSNYDSSFLNQKLQWNKYWLGKSFDLFDIIHNDLVEEFLLLMQVKRSVISKVVCDLGCGYGQDSIFLAENDLIVQAIDFADHALHILDRNAHTLALSSITTTNANLENGLPFKDNSCGGVYSHLGLHYFHKSTLKIIFEEIHRVLIPEGVLVFNVKSDKDPSYGLGQMIEPNMYDNNGHIRHFFSFNLIQELLIKWEIINLEEYSVSPDVHHTYFGTFIKVSAIKAK